MHTTKRQIIKEWRCEVEGGHATHIDGFTWVWVENSDTEEGALFLFPEDAIPGAGEVGEQFVHRVVRCADGAIKGISMTLNADDVPLYEQRRVCYNYV